MNDACSVCTVLPPLSVTVHESHEIGEMSNDASVSGVRWTDVLSPRRNSSDIVWLLSHPWNSATNVFSKQRTAVAVRDDVFEEPVIKAILNESPHLRKKIETILEEMAHNWSLKYIRFVGFFLTKVMKSIYRHVLVFDRIIMSKSSILYPFKGNTTSSVINEIAEKYPILYMPTHRSYADFLLFSYICFHMNLPLPSIAAGIDFLALNQVASLLRACGAFFIRRSFKNSGDLLYWHTFRAYVQTQLRGGERPMEFFIEGTRSRSGKFLFPKTGLLSIAVELLLTSQIPDLIIVPISITYDRTLEGELYAKELVSPKFHPSSGTKPKETTKHLLQGAKNILSQDFGSVFIRFGEPMSLKEICDKRSLRKAYSLQPLGTEVTFENPEQVNFINYISFKVIEEQKRMLVVSPFTIFCLCVVSETYRDSTLTVDTTRSFPISQAVNDIESLYPLFEQQCLSHIINGRSVYEEFLEYCKMHEKLVAFSNGNILVSIGNPLILTQLQHYSNQAFQLVINVALCCYSDHYNDFCILQDLLCKEFIFSEIGSKQTYEYALNLKRSLSDRVNYILSSETAYFIDCYFNVLELLKSFQSPFSSLKELIKSVHSNSEVTLDIVQNVIHLLCEKSIIRRAPNVIDVHKLMHFHERIDALKNRKPYSMSQLRDSMKAKL